jgi:hypothetical protein
MKLVDTVLLIMIMPVWGSVDANPQQQSSDSEPSSGGLEVVTSRLANYAKIFSQITFYHLKDTKDLVKLSQLTNQLGNGASNVDYEHPPDLRVLLLEAQIGRIELMLNYQMPSSTLFKTGINSYFQTPYLCVITLDVTIFMTDEMAATRFIARRNNFNAVIFPVNAALDNLTFLNFTIDHEVFHCLDAYINGPTRPQTKSQLTASYNDYRAELRADIFAALMYRNTSKPSSFLFKLANYRSLNIKDWDVTHYSSTSLIQVSNLEDSAIKSMGVRTILESAVDLAEMNIMSRDCYASFIISAAEVAVENSTNEGVLSGEVIEAKREGFGALEVIKNRIRQDITYVEQQISQSVASQ